MFHRTIFVAVICLTIVEAFAGSIRIRPQTTIIPVQEGHQSSLGVVNGVRSCGGNGKFIQLRFESCNGSEICQIPGDGQFRRSELEFIPNENASQLGTMLVVITEGQVARKYDRQIEDSQVEAGKTYMIVAGGAISSELQGKQFTAQYVVYSVETNEVETCIEADFEVV